MVNQITLTGMILTAAPIGEYDRRVVILTRERGKISAFARGARRPNSALMGVTSPFSFGEFTVYEGRTSYTLVSASISNYFQELRTDVEGAYYGFYFMDLAGYYAREANDETEMLKLLYQTLRALTNVHIPNELIRCINYRERGRTAGDGMYYVWGQRAGESVQYTAGWCDMRAVCRTYFRWNPAASVDIIYTAVHRVFSS